MKTKISKTEAKEQIDEFFSHIKEKTSKDVKKIKNLAMKHNIKLGDKRKLFCKKCFNSYVNSSINLKNGFLNIECSNCGYKSRWKIKKEVDLGIRYNENEADGCC